MREYTRFEVVEGAYAEVQEVFKTMEDALNYIEDRYGADNAVDQLVEINASNDDFESETFTELEIYDMLNNRSDGK